MSAKLSGWSAPHGFHGNRLSQITLVRFAAPVSHREHPPPDPGSAVVLVVGGGVVDVVWTGVVVLVVGSVVVLVVGGGVVDVVWTGVVTQSLTDVLFAGDDVPEGQGVHDPFPRLLLPLMLKLPAAQGEGSGQKHIPSLIGSWVRATSSGLHRWFQSLGS